MNGCTALDSAGKVACGLPMALTCAECGDALCGTHARLCSVPICQAVVCQRHAHEWVIGCGPTRKAGVWCTECEREDRRATR